MKLIKYFFALSCLAMLLTACQKEEFDDTGFAGSAAAPDNLALMFDITQDNSGNVTILPNGEGVSAFEVDFGDATPSTANVQPGNSIVHNYVEGTYIVKLIGHSVSGKTTEITNQLTVTFRAPENVEVTTAVDPANNLRLNVSASALYETNFRVYFGDRPDETPTLMLEGQTISHTYSATGTYILRVVAVSGGAATTEVTRTMTIVDPLLLPVNFESPTVNYSFGNFDGGNSTVVANPHITGINTSATVARMIKFAGQPWGGSVLSLNAPIDFTAGKIFQMKVWSPRVGAKVLLKVENASNSAISFEKEVETTVANGWEDLTFDYSAINTNDEYQNIVLMFELGTMGDGSSNFTFYFDDIRLVSNTPPVALPLNFENPLLDYSFTNFDGGVVTVENNPYASGMNTSSTVARMVKYAGQPWGGSFIALDNPIDFSAGKIFKAKVWSPRVGAKVLLKVENATDGGISFESEATTTVANGWEELTFDYSAINTANSYQKIVLIFDLGTTGDGSPNFTFFFDDIILTN